MRIKQIALFIFLTVLTFSFSSPVYGEELNLSTSKKIVILPFEVFGPSEYAYLKKALPEMLASRLFLPSKVEILDIDRYYKKNLKIDYIIKGKITIIGKNASIDINILNTKTKNSFRLFQKVSDLSELIESLDILANKILVSIKIKEEKSTQKTFSFLNFQSQPEKKAKPKVKKATSPYLKERGGLTSNLVIDVSTGQIGWDE